MKDILLKLISKEVIVEFALGLLLRFLQHKPSGKFATFITSDKMQNTMSDINKYYEAYYEAWHKAQNPDTEPSLNFEGETAN